MKISSRIAGALLALPTFYLASHALAADVAGPPLSVLTSGIQVEGSLGTASYSGISGNAGSIDALSRGIWGASLTAGAPFGDRFSLQGDLVLDGDFIDPSAYTGYLSGVVAAGHASWRDPSRGLFGVFGGFGSQQPADDEAASLWFLGAEGQLYCDRFTAYGQLGYLDSHDSEESDSFHNAVFVRGVGRYFLTDSTMIAGDLAFASGRQDSGGLYPMSVTTWGLKLEHALASMPVSLSVGYEGMYATNGNSGDNGTFTDNRFVVAAKFFFNGSNNLYQNDRLGQTLDLPKFGRMVGAGTEVD